MKKFITLMFVLTTAVIFGQSASNVLTGSAQPPLPFNIIPQPGFENRTTGWSVTGGVFTTTSVQANLARGRYSAQWTLPVSIAAGVILQSDNVAIPAGLYARDCEGQILYKGAGATNGTLVFEASDGTNLLGTVSLADVTTYTQLQTTTFTCPSSGNLRLRIRSTATSPAVPTAMYFDEAVVADSSSVGMGTAIKSLGNLGGTPNAQGASISGVTLTLRPASATQPGAVTTGAQSFAGAKTFVAPVIGSLNGNADTATAFFTLPTSCTGIGQYAYGIDASGNLTCATPGGGGAFGNVTGPVSSTNKGIATWNGAGGNVLFDNSATITSGVITASGFVGPLTGNVTGNLTGNVTGNLTGNVTGNTSGTAASITGNLTGDVTSVGMATTIPAASVTNAQLAGSIADSKLSTISTAAKVSNSATTATSANTASAIVARDASNNFIAGTITASLTGHSSLDLPLTGGTLSGALNMGTNLINSVVDPVSAQDAATKHYVDITSGNPLTTKGDIYGFSTIPARVPVGADGLVLKADSANANGVSWSSVAGTGDVVGPAGATANAIARYNSTTGKLIKDSTVIVDDVGAVSGLRTITPVTDDNYQLGSAAKQWSHAFVHTIGPAELFTGSYIDVTGQLLNDNAAAGALSWGSRQLLDTSGVSVLDWGNAGFINVNSGYNLKLLNGTTNRALFLNASKIVTASATTATELGFVNGVTSAIQTQIDGKQSTTLTSAHLLVGNGSNVATDTAVTGDVTISNAGVTAIGATKVTNAMLAGSIDVTTKLTGVLPAAQFPALTGDITTSSGALATTAAATQANIVTLSKSSGVAVHGTNTNDAASAGYVGEYISASQTTLTNFTTSTNWGDCTSISLTAGDWDVYMTLYTTFISGTSTRIQYGIGTVTGNDASGLTQGVSLLEILPPTSAANSSGTVFERVSLSGSASIYAKVNSTWTTTSPQYKCGIYARRRR